MNVRELKEILEFQDDETQIFLEDDTGDHPIVSAHAINMSLIWHAPGLVLRTKTISDTIASLNLPVAP